jgi:hypothetical protein
MLRLLPLLVIAAALASTTAGSASSGTCTFKGPAWTSGSSTGTDYNMDVQGVSCSFAVPFARKLAGTKNPKPYYPVKGGPAGWNCNSMAPGPKITSGACVKGTKRFGWHAASF